MNPSLNSKIPPDIWRRRETRHNVPGLSPSPDIRQSQTYSAIHFPARPLRLYDKLSEKKSPLHEWDEEVRATQQYPTDRASLERDCSIEFFIASGPGGQHRNKVETGVRLVHQPSGIMVTATERRSQSANREMAFERMEERLQRLQRRLPPRIPTRPSKASHERRLQAKRHRALSKLRRTTAIRRDE